MNGLRLWAIAAVLVAGMSAAEALGRNNFLGQLSSLLTAAEDGIADPAQKQSVIDAVAILQTAPGVEQFDNLQPDLTVASKAVAALGAASTDVNVSAAVNMFLPIAWANVVGRGAQANTVATARLSPLQLFGFVKKVTNIKSALDKALNDTKLTPAKKLKKFAGFAKKYDKLYQKYK